MGIGNIVGSVVGSVIGAAGARSAAKAQSSAARYAADAQLQAAREANELQKRIYEENVARQQPFLQTGTQFFNQLAALQRGGPQAAQNFLQMDPGYGFRLSEGMKALERSAAARGGLLSGGAGRALTRYGQDVASQEYGAAYNRLAGLADVGPRAAGVMSGLGQAYAGEAGRNLLAGGQAAAQGILGAGSARASGYMGTANALAGGIGQYLQYQQNQDLMNTLQANRVGMQYTPGYEGGYSYGEQLPNVGPQLPTY